MNGAIAIRTFTFIGRDRNVTCSPAFKVISGLDCPAIL